MPERSFGRTVRYRRTKLGLSQAKLGDLVGRSAATIRSWEAGKTTPNDSKVLATLSAILGVDERTIFGKAGLEPPVADETSPTIEQALASLAPEPAERDSPTVPDSSDAEATIDQDPAEDEDGAALPAVATVPRAVPLAPVAPFPPAVLEPKTGAEGAPGTTTQQMTTITPRQVGEPSYIEDWTQKQMYRVRTLATLVALVALVIALLWAAGESVAALGDWWDDFIATLRL